MSDRKVSDSNQQTYQRLKAALSLSLRRQIFLAICDDLRLRNRLAAQLQTELTDRSEATANSSASYPEIVTLHLNGSDPNPIDRIGKWLDRHPPPKNWEDRTQIPKFQIVGIEHLTRQPSTIQRRFLNNLQQIAKSLLSPSFLHKYRERDSSILESSILLWMPKPWLLSIEQSAADFWDCHTGIFEFSGEPTPVPEENINEWDWVKNYSEDSDLPSAGFSPIALQQAESRSYARPSATQLGLLDPEDRPSNGKTGDRQEEMAAPPANSKVAVAPLVEKQIQKKQQPKTEVDTYRTLGNFYRDRLERGETTTENVRGAIAAYEKALEYLDENASVWSDLLNDIGNLYWMLSRETRSNERSRSYLEQGINAYEIAISKTDAATHLSSYIRLQKNLGAAYGEFARYQQPVANLQQSIAAYQEALRYYSREERQDSQVGDFDPLQYASAQNNLGTTYWNLAQHQQSATNLKRAIAAYREALPYYNPETDLENPSLQALNYGMIQNNLGTAYWNLAQYEQPQDYLQLAIWAYRSALKYRTVTAAPAASAATQNNLGTAYWHLADREGISWQKRVESLQLCIAAYERAIEIASNLNGVNGNLAISLNFDLFATHNNLAIAHYQLATDTEVTVERKCESDPFPTPKDDNATHRLGNRASHLEAALEHHLHALQGWQQQPELYRNALSYVIQTIRAFYRECGLPGQNLALSKVPGTLLPEILQRL